MLQERGPSSGPQDQGDPELRLSTFGVATNFAQKLAWSAAIPKPRRAATCLSSLRRAFVAHAEACLGGVEILYGVGVSAAGEIVDLASEAGLLEKSGAYYSWNGERIAQGRDKTCQYMSEHPELAAELRDKLVALRKAENARLGAGAGHRRKPGCVARGWRSGRGACHGRGRGVARFT